MNYNQIEVTHIPKNDGYEWVKIRMLNGNSFVPSFAQLVEIVRAICDCEDIKYPHGQGRNMVRDILKDAIEQPHRSFESLALKYDIPRTGPPPEQMPLIGNSEVYP